MDRLNMHSVDFTERTLEKYLNQFKDRVAAKRYDQLKTSYKLTGKFDMPLGELKTIFKRAEWEGIFISLCRNGQILSNNIKRCYFFSYLYSLLPLLLALMLTLASFVMFRMNKVPDYVFLAFIIATFIYFFFVTLSDFLNRLERIQMINNNKNS